MLTQEIYNIIAQWVIQGKPERVKRQQQRNWAREFTVEWKWHYSEKVIVIERWAKWITFHYASYSHDPCAFVYNERLRLERRDSVCPTWVSTFLNFRLTPSIAVGFNDQTKQSLSTSNVLQHASPAFTDALLCFSESKQNITSRRVWRLQLVYESVGHCMHN